MNTVDFKMISFVLASALALSCNSSDQLDTLLKQSPKDTVFMGVEPVLFEDGTRTSAGIDEAGGLTFKWSDGDAVGVYSTEGGFSRFGLVSGSGTGLAVFDGQGFSLTPGSTYYASYPYDGGNTSSANVPVSYASRSVSGDNSLDDIVRLDPMHASAEVDEEGRANFSFKHLSSFLRITATLPEKLSFSRLDLIPTYEGLASSGSLDIRDGKWKADKFETAAKIPLEGISATEDDRDVALWVPLAPQDMRGNDIAAVCYGSDGMMYSSRIDGRNFKSGTAYRCNAEMVQYSGSQGSDISVSNLGSYTLSSLPSGQYSGITRISGHRYAVVHDKAAGGGIYIVSFSFDETGSLVSTDYEIPAGTSSSTVSRDPEGVAYFPKAGTLFVSGEGDQRILEYSLDGYPTGRELAIPEDISNSSISANSGLESLTYNDNTGLFWTTTETGLRKDADVADSGGRLMRLQSFESDLSAGKRYFYLTDGPEKSSSSARNYAYGISDLLALDDGRLIVMEREAYIPNGSYFEIAANTVVKIKLYEVDPVTDKGGILSKRLVKEFSVKGALSFANYEGICLGENIGGSQSVLLISDSQDRYQGLLQDWLKVFTID